MLRDLGFRVCRVRYHGEIARIEVEPEMFPRLFSPEVCTKISATFKEIGFLYIAVDLQGFRSGSLNEAVRPENADSLDS